MVPQSAQGRIDEKCAFHHIGRQYEYLMAQQHHLAGKWSAQARDSTRKGWNCFGGAALLRTLLKCANHHKPSAFWQSDRVGEVYGDGRSD
jgi:hypothetical protein